MTKEADTIKVWLRKKELTGYDTKLYLVGKKCFITDKVHTIDLEKSGVRLTGPEVHYILIKAIEELGA